MTDPAQNEPGRRILVVRLSAIGDLVFASPLIAALRRAYPDATLAWLAQPEHSAVLERHPDLDLLIQCPFSDWKRLAKAGSWGALFAEIRAFRQLLRGLQFDVAIDVQGLMKSALLAWFSGAPERIGLGSREGSNLLMTRVIPAGGRVGRISSEYLHLAEVLGLPVDDFSMQVHTGAHDQAFAAEVVGDEPTAVLCPFTTRPQKHWIEARWAQLARRIRDELGLRVLMLGGPGDCEAAARIAAEADGTITDLAGETTLLQAAAIIGRAALLVGVDTGLSHMAIAQRRPCVLLFGSTRPYLDTCRRDAAVLYQALDCSPCRRRPTCDGRFDCMRAIDCDQILARAREVMSLAEDGAR